MQVWNLLHAARCKCRTQKIVKNSPSARHCTTLGYIFATKAHVDNQEKNLFNSNISPTCPHNMVNFGPRTAEICWQVWGTPANFSGFRVLAALLHRPWPTSLNRSQPNFARCLIVCWTATLHIHFFGDAFATCKFKLQHSLCVQALSCGRIVSMYCRLALTMFSQRLLVQCSSTACLFKGWLCGLLTRPFLVSISAFVFGWNRPMLSDRCLSVCL